jgi:hypothetical protein
MLIEDYKAFVNLKDLLYTIGQDGLLDSDTRRMRDELIARLYTIRNPEAVAKALKMDKDGG